MAGRHAMGKDDSKERDDLVERDDPVIERDKAYSPASERETQSRQEDPDASEATADDDIDSADVRVLPGTGGPDDPGDIEVDEDDINLPT